MNYVEVKPLRDDLIDLFITDYNLFTIFDAPVNVLFINNFIDNIKKYKDIFMNFKMHNNIFFSCKSNKSFSFLKAASDEHCGIEVSSIYELKDALMYTHKIIASGPAKDDDYLRLAVVSNVIISVDDVEELKKIKKMNDNVRVLLRISNLVNIVSRFGISIFQIDECLEIIKDSEIKLEGFSFHINNYNLDDRVKAVKKIINLIQLKNIEIKYIDIGGGFPVSYCSKKSYIGFLKNNKKGMYFKNKEINDFYPYYNEISDSESLNYILKRVHFKLKGVEIIIEPGRSLLNNCGISIYKVEYLKHLFDGENLIITNGNINCLSEQWFNTDYLIEPMLYKKNKSSKLIEPLFASIAGNLCLEQDVITWRKIKFDYLPENGDYLIYYNTAGYQMDSNESNFHKIPLVKKKVVVKRNNKFYIKGDDEYGR
jgi:diaminopimelate decarboxylase